VRLASFASASGRFYPPMQLGAGFVLLTVTRSGGPQQETALLPAPFWCTYAWNRPTSTGADGSDPRWLCWRGRPLSRSDDEATPHPSGVNWNDNESVGGALARAKRRRRLATHVSKKELSPVTAVWISPDGSARWTIRLNTRSGSWRPARSLPCRCSPALHSPSPASFTSRRDRPQNDRRPGVAQREPLCDTGGLLPCAFIHIGTKIAPDISIWSAAITGQLTWSLSQLPASWWRASPAPS